MSNIIFVLMFGLLAVFHSWKHGEAVKEIMILKSQCIEWKK